MFGVHIMTFTIGLHARLPLCPFPYPQQQALTCALLAPGRSMRAAGHACHPCSYISASLVLNIAALG